MGSRMRRILFIVLILLIVNVACIASANQYTFKLVKWTSGHALPEAVFYVDVDAVNWTRCEVEAALASTVGGLLPELAGAECEILGNKTVAKVRIKFAGTYVGGDLVILPITSLRVKLYYDNGTVVERIFRNVGTINVYEVHVSSIRFNGVIGVKGHVTQPPSYRVGEFIAVVPVATASVSMTLSDVPTVPPTLTGVFRAGNIETKMVFSFRHGERTAVSVGELVLSDLLLYEVYHGEYVVHSGQMALPSLPRLIIYIGVPYFRFFEGKIFVQTDVYVTYLEKGTVEVKAFVTTKETPSASANFSANKPGYYNLTVRLRDKSIPPSIHVVYEVQFKHDFGSYVFSITHYSQTHYGTGRIGPLFFMMFNAMLAASLFMTIGGFFLRRVDMMSNGLVIILVIVLIYGSPTIISRVITSVIDTKYDPVGLRELDMLNLGDKIDMALILVKERARLYGSLLHTIGNYVYKFLGVIIALAAAGAVLGVISFGGAQNLAAALIKTFGPSVFTGATVLSAAGAALMLVAEVYPIFIKLVIALSVISVILSALITMVTGNLSSLVNSVLTLLTIILLVLLVPSVLAAIDEARDSVTKAGALIDLDIPEVLEEFLGSEEDKRLIIPNPAAYIGLILFELAILSMVMFMSLRRLIVTLATMGGQI